MGSKGRGRRVVIAYSLVAAATQVLWLTFAPIDTSAAHHYGVSTGAIGWLAEIFPLLYVVLVHHPTAAFLSMAAVSIPAVALAERWVPSSAG